MSIANFKSRDPSGDRLMPVAKVRVRVQASHENITDLSLPPKKKIFRLAKKKLQYYIVVDVIRHISKLKRVAESFTIHRVYPYRGVPIFLLNLLQKTFWFF